MLSLSLVFTYYSPIKLPASSADRICGSACVDVEMQVLK